MDFVIILFRDGFYLPWVNLPFVYRWLVATVLMGYPAAYLFQAYQYRRLAREAGASIHLAPISVKGGIVGELGARGVGLALRANWSAIVEPSWKDTNGQASLYPRQFTGRHFLVAMDLANVGAYLIPLRLSEHPAQWTLKEDVVVKIGTFEIPVGTLANLLLAILRVLPVPYRKRYLDSLIYVSLISVGDQTQLLVSRQGQKLKAAHGLNVEEKSRAAGEVTVLSETKTVTNIEGLSGDLLRDAVFMILQLHGKGFAQQHWRSMSYVGDGLDALEEYRRTANEALVGRARESFRRAVQDDHRNYMALYFFGAMLMVERTRETIASAIRAFTQALATKDVTFRAFVNAGLAYCYAQQYHRLAERDPDVLSKAHNHAAEARNDWDQATGTGRQHPLILAILAMVQHVDEGDEESRVETKKRFLGAAALYLQVIEIEPENGMYYNNLGWVLMKLAEWDIEDLKPEDGIPGEIIGYPAKTAEKYFRRSLSLNPSNKLTHANLCLLYATPWYRGRERKKYLDRCRYHGLMAIRIDPVYINGHRDLSLSLLRYGEFDEAYSFFEKALRLAPTIDKEQEIINDALKVLEEMGVKQKERKRWGHPDPKLLEPPG